MKKTVLLCLLLTPLSASLLKAERLSDRIIADTIPLDRLAEKAKEYYNENDTDSLYTLMGKAFVEKIGEQQFKQISNTIRSQFGHWKSSDRESFQNGVATYKAVFQNATALFSLSTDIEGKIATYSFTPYTSTADIKRKTQKPLSDNQLKTQLDSLADKHIQDYITRENTCGISVAIITPSKTCYYNYGEKKVGEKNLPDSLTLFEIGSLTKTFTATLLAKYYMDGKLSLQEPVSKYLPDSIRPLQYNKVPITMLSLSNHSSGLPRMPGNFDKSAKITPNNPYVGYSEDLLFSYLKNFTPYRAPGAQYEYSNLAAGLLGTILGRVSGKSFQEMLQADICKPLGMSHTTQTLTPEQRSSLAQGYSEKLEVRPPWDFLALAGAGSIRSNTRDIARYVQAQLGLITSELDAPIVLTHEPTFIYGQQVVGMGWFLGKKSKTEDVYNHTGKTGGYSSFTAFDMVRKTGIVVLTNGAGDIGSWPQKLLGSIENE